MKNRITPFQIRLTALMLFAIILSSCTTNFYPPRVNAPLLREKGEGKIDAAAGIGAVHFHGAYAFSESWAVSGGYTKFDVADYERFKGSSFNANVGYFIPLDEKWVFDVYGGYGQHNIESSDIIRGIAHSFSLQPSIGRRGKFFEGAFSLKITDVRVDKSQTFNDYSMSPLKDDLRSIVFEPVVSLGIGYKNMKFTTQFGLALSGTMKSSTENLNWGAHEIAAFPLILNVGLQYRFKAPLAE